MTSTYLSVGDVVRFEFRNPETGKIMSPATTRSIRRKIAPSGKMVQFYTLDELPGVHVPYVSTFLKGRYLYIPRYAYIEPRHRGNYDGNFYIVDHSFYLLDDLENVVLKRGFTFRLSSANYNSIVVVDKLLDIREYPREAIRTVVYDLLSPEIQNRDIRMNTEGQTDIEHLNFLRKTVPHIMVDNLADKVALAQFAHLNCPHCGRFPLKIKTKLIKVSEYASLRKELSDYASRNNVVFFPLCLVCKHCAFVMCIASEKESPCEFSRAVAVHPQCLSNTKARVTRKKGTPSTDIPLNTIGIPNLVATLGNDDDD